MMTRATESRVERTYHDFGCEELDSDNSRLVPSEWDEWTYDDCEWVKYPKRGLDYAED